MKSHRRERVASVVRDIVCHAVAHQLNDPRIDPLTTITRVEMVGDLEIARVYITVSGGEATERRTLTALRHARGFLQCILASEMVIRQCPAIEFQIDVAAKRARETMDLIAENRRKHPELFEEESPVDDDADEEADASEGAGSNECGSGSENASRFRGDEPGSGVEA